MTDTSTLTHFAPPTLATVEVPIVELAGNRIFMTMEAASADVPGVGNVPLLMALPGGAYLIYPRDGRPGVYASTRDLWNAMVEAHVGGTR